MLSQSLRPDTADRLIDALAVLLVRLHLLGFYWGDVSLSNTLFRRDADAYAAYVVDAETGAVPRLGPAALRELVHQFAGIISWIWMLVDDDDRTLADIVGKTHVVHADRG